MDPVDGPILASLLGKSSGVGCIWSFVLGAQDLSLLRCLLAELWGILTACREMRALREPIFEAVGWEHFWGLQVPSPVCSTVGPCALEYTKMKTADHFWTDPSADELVQRHRIHSSHLRQDSPTKRPALCVRWVGSVRASGRV